MPETVEYRKGVHKVPKETGSRRAKKIDLSKAGKKKREEVMDAFHKGALRVEGEIVTDWQEADKFAMTAAENVSVNPITQHSQF
jgi:hypothetical protein|tara:strand:+ start:1020 stop:1271 length:252 start_codon:yes stop_codon:yes gene_type:complete